MSELKKGHGETDSSGKVETKNERDRINMTTQEKERNEFVCEWAQNRKHRVPLVTQRPE